MAYTSTQLEDLEAAMAQGVLMVQYGDKTITYRSLKEMQILRDVMRRELGIATPSQRKVATFDKGIFEDR